MSIKRILMTAAAGATAALALVAGSLAADPPKDGKPIAVKIGVLARDAPDLTQVSKALKKEGIDMQVVVFDDNIAMQHATEEGSLNANYFQSANYLASYVASNPKSKLVKYGPWLHTNADVFVSKKYDSINAIPSGGKIGIANDSFNTSRELKLIETTGLIKLKPGVNLATPLDVVTNPKNLKFIQVDPRSRVGAFPDLDAMTAPGITVHLMKDPGVKVLAMETPEVYKEYGGNYWVTANVEANKAWLDAAIRYMSTNEYKDWIKKEYNGLKMTP
ncbi:MAG: MetQ/NlpA family ABC transporter substrate-binding protein [Burkholderiales bacterium]